MATTLRCLAILAAIVLVALLITPTLHAAGPQSVADLTLLNAANRDRAAAGLPALQWDSNLAAAAHQHALLMAQRNTLSHQFPGDLPCRIALVAPERVFHSSRKMLPKDQTSPGYTRSG